MSAIKLSHPNADQLASFASGQAREDVASEISEHLAGCGACRTLVEALPDDTLLSLLRKPAGPAAPMAETPSGASAEALASTALADAASAAPREGQLPAELTNHPRYQILELLGSGGMGAVYKGEHRLMERKVALKVIHPRLMSRPIMVERFHREVKAVARFSHPHIVSAYDADQAGEAHFLVMEFVEGISLAQQVEKHGPLPVDQACEYIRQAALGLQFAAEHGMVHRDIKPHNLMLTSAGQVKILDFGLARLMREETGRADVREHAGNEASELTVPLTEVGMLMGTADFIAPEQADDPRQADIYSLGCTLYYLLTGKVPFPGQTISDKLAAHREQKPVPLAKLRGDIPTAFASVLDRMMAKDPAQRYQTPAEAAEALRPFTAASAAWRRRVRRLLLTAASLAACLFLASLIYIQFDKGELVIDTDDDKLAVMVNDKGVKIRDLEAKREYLLKIGRHRLRTGEYRIDVEELPAGVKLSTEAFHLRRGDKTVATVTFNPKTDPGYLKDEALRWFPADATYFTAGNLEAFPEFAQFNLLLWRDMDSIGKRWANTNGDRFRKFVDLIGPIDRVACAYVVDRQHPDEGREFVRLTGSIKHNRLVDYFRQEWPGVTIEQTESKGELLTLIHDPKSGSALGIALALIGTTDLIMSGYHGPTKNHLEAIHECLALRAGRGVSLPVAQAKVLEEIPADAWVLGVGEPPTYFKKAFVPALLRPARAIVMSAAGTNDIQVRFRGSFSSAADAMNFQTTLNAMKVMFMNASVVIKNPDLSAAVAKMFKNLSIESEAERTTVNFQIPGVAWAAFLEKIQDIPLRDWLGERGKE